MTPSELEDAVSKATAHFIIEYKKHSDTKYDFNLRGKKNFWNVRLDFSSGFNIYWLCSSRQYQGYCLYTGR